MGIADGAGVRGRDQATVPGIMGEFLRRINVVQEWTVEAALTGDRTLVLEAMLADPMAGQLAYDDIVDDDRRDARRHRPVAPAVPLAGRCDNARPPATPAEVPE